LNPRPKVLLSGFYMFSLAIESRIPGCRQAGVPESHPPLSYSGARGKSPEPACCMTLLPETQTISGQRLLS